MKRFSPALVQKGQKQFHDIQMNTMLWLQNMSI